MSSIEFYLNSVRNYMYSHYMIVSEDWLSECVSHCLENNFNEDKIKELTKEQWLLNNLTDVSPGCLPKNLASISKMELMGPYVLQVNALEDIGNPAYQQYLKLQKVNTENIEATERFDDKISSRRMLKLHMTDGVQNIVGIEYTPLRNIPLDFKPGCKVLIKGPVSYMQGILLLTENSIEFIGGEVMELIIANSKAAILSNQLNLSISQGSTTNQLHSSAHNQNTHLTIHDQQTEKIASFNEDDLDMEQLEAIEAQYCKTSTKRCSEDDISNPDKKIKRSCVSSSNYVDDYPENTDMFFEDEEQFKELEAKFNEMENDIKINDSAGCSGPSRSKSSDLSDVMSPSATSIDERPPLDSVSIRTSSEPFVYIKQINEMDEIERVGKVFKVKAQILKILSKLTVSKNGWSLSCTIVDGTGAIDVDFSNDVLSKLVGITHQQMMKMKKQMATNAEVKNATLLALQKVKDNLQVLYCIIELIITDCPMITQLIPFESCHADALIRRLQDSRL